jgi:DNA-binding GntR family transcriptional regulator
LDADKKLDEALTAAADNKFAARLVAPLQTHSRRFWYRYQRNAGLAEAAEHHVDIVRAVLDGNEAHAGREAERLIALLRLHAEAAARK